MSSSSRERIVLKRRLTGVRLALTDVPGGGPSGHSRLKEVQRRAYERGVAHEREQWTKKLDRLAAEVAAERADAGRRRAAEAAEIESFAVRLAAQVAEKLVHGAVAAGRHDVRAMVADLLEQLSLAESAPGPEIRMHPDDHAHLVASLAERPASRPLDAAALVPDPGVTRGSFLLRTEDTTLYSVLSERLESLRARLLDVAKGAHA